MAETMSFRHFETGLRIKVIKFIIMQLPVRKAIDSEINLESRKHKGFSVTKQKDTTRSHPEHGRKDFLRRQYSEGSLPGR